MASSLQVSFENTPVSGTKLHFVMTLKNCALFLGWCYFFTLTGCENVVLLLEILGLLLALGRLC